MQKYFEQVATHYSSFEDFDQAEADNLFGLGKKGRRKRELKKQRGEMQHDRKLAEIELEKRATEKMLRPETVALNDVEDNKPIIQSYVRNAGQVPQRNPAALALQATQVFQNKVSDRQAKGVPDYEQAVEAEMDDTTDQWNEDNGDQFFGAIITSVFKAGNAVVKKINEKREKDDKKPLFAGKNWQKLAQKYKDNEGVVDDALTAAEKAFLALTVKENAKVSTIEAGKNAIVNYQTEQAIRKYLPWALIALLIAFMLGKKLKV